MADDDDLNLVELS